MKRASAESGYEGAAADRRVVDDGGSVARRAPGARPGAALRGWGSGRIAGPWALLAVLVMAPLGGGCETTAGGGAGGTDALASDTAVADTIVADTTVADTTSPDTALADAMDSMAGDTATADASGGCPAVPPDAPGACAGQQSCEYGEECCCGACSPSIVCACDGAIWSCHATDACLACIDAGGAEDVAGDAGPADAGPADATDATGDVQAPSCPAEAPIGVGVCGEPTTCEYGEECCCGQCYPSLVCSCGAAGWSCYATDACMIAGCPCHGDADCSNSQSCAAPDDPGSCGNCQEPVSTCTQDVDCASTPGTVCDVPKDGCFCDPSPQCIPACSAVQGCAEGESCAAGHCVPTPCTTGADCPTFFTCEQDAAGQCARATCSDDAACGAVGSCVNGRCYGQLGLCQYQVP